ncbi:PPOX class F420-dependent oxidoreductase [Amycolatopsis sp. PS_44_ISF1]|uniref:PPOX class F420-dependent oxidoreductase n=1 Tax=Amycolatopsis sp. PS_44_ISF1 TaxID=2974917 RepID=UPI0028DD45FA|nr:PPOX class F420-dependent oxidoreductase [Amycolatopsis sp. PS_44_ISF1]MDT8913612.1 PPOX class F420-dependent oxidoreductase [Amycolatopsis sp. PS_44_ISF1]
MFTEKEIRYMAEQHLCRVATAQPDGTLQVSPVGFSYNPGTCTIDLLGLRLSTSRRFRNVADNGRIALVIDDVPSTDPWRVRSLEIRGHAEALTGVPTPEQYDNAMICVHPHRIIAIGVEDWDLDYTRQIPHSRTV